MTTTLVVNAAIVTVNGADDVIDPGWILIEDNFIDSLGPGQPGAAVIGRAENSIDCSGMAVMPGMVNAHTHLFQAFFRGLADDKPLLEWLKDCIWPGASHLDTETAYLAAKIGIVENLLGGATSIVDHQYVHADPLTSEAVCRAADDLGVRFVLARGWADRNYHEALTETADEIISRCRSLHAEWDGANHGLINVEIGPLIPWGCSDEAMRRVINETRAWGRGTHHHCAETAVEVDMSLEERGVRHVPWLRDLGALGPDAQLVHSVWLDDEEIDIIAQTGSIVVHCPVSNMYLASGVPRIPEMLAAGVTVALASDGPGSNNRQDMFEAMKASILLQKVHHLEAMVLQPEDALAMACRGGAAALARSGDLGSIETGRRADLTFVDLRSPHIAPVHSVASALVFCATPQDVVHVMIDGSLVVKDGAIPGLDLEALLDEATDAAAELFSRAGIQSRLNR